MIPTTAANIDGTEGPSLTTNSEFDEYAQPPTERYEIQPLIAPEVERDQDSAQEIVSQDDDFGAKTVNVSRLESSRVALVASVFASCLRVRLVEGLLGAILR